MTKLANPYHVLGDAFISSVVAGGQGKIEGKQEGLSGRLRQYAYYMQENAVDAGDALLVNDLLDAAKRLTPKTRCYRCNESIEDGGQADGLCVYCFASAGGLGSPPRT